MSGTLREKFLLGVVEPTPPGTSRRHLEDLANNPNGSPLRNLAGIMIRHLDERPGIESQGRSYIRVGKY